ncbi:MAG: hypothetical protein NTX36_15390 [Proteobacteria bacterium]|nr:hypothetical protein [Pseudomonadota bacterium]
MTANYIDRAKALFERAINNFKFSHEKALSAYNMAILKLKSEDLLGALETLDLCIQLDQQSTYNSENLACLLVPNDTGQEITIDEVKNPDLITTAVKARQTLISFIERTKPVKGPRGMW